MTRSAEPVTFVIERTYNATPAKVFSMWSSREQKMRWFGQPNEKYRLDFRIGGEEHNEGGPPGGPLYAFKVVYREIVPNERFVFQYTMDADDVTISVSVAAVTFEAQGNGTLLTYTEQGIFLDGLEEIGVRHKGTESLLDNLATVL